MTYRFDIADYVGLPIRPGDRVTINDYIPCFDCEPKGTALLVDNTYALVVWDGDPKRYVTPKHWLARVIA